MAPTLNPAHLSAQDEQHRAEEIIRQLREDLDRAVSAERTLRLQLDELRTSRWRSEIRLEGRSRHLERTLELREHTIRALYQSKSWRVTGPLRASVTWAAQTKTKLRLLLRAFLPNGSAERAALRGRLGQVIPRIAETSSSEIELQYPTWHARYQQLSTEDEGLIRQQMAKQQFPPVHVIWDLRQADQAGVRAAVRSLQAQLHEAWTANLWVSRDVEVGSAPHGDELSDSRVRCIQQDDGETSIGADACTVLVDRPGELAPHALYLLLEAAQGLQGSSVVLADEDELGPDGIYRHPRLTARYSPELPTTGSIALFVPEKGGGGNPYGLATLEYGLHALVRGKALREPSPPAHAPFIAFHAAAAPPLEGTENDAMLQGDDECLPFVNVIIPTRDRFELMEPCISSLLAKTDYPRDRYEITVVDNGSTETALLEYLDRLARASDIRVLKDPRSFNYARLNNLAVAATRGDLLAFVNNDIVVHDSAWLRRLAFHATKPGVGAVGAKLLYPDMTVQHGGVVLGVQGVAAHAHHHLAADAPGYLGLSTTTHAISAVTGACLMIRRQLFENLGGFNEELAVAFNDTMLCMDALASGLRNVYVHHPLLIHYESKSRGLDDTSEKQALFRREARYARSRYRRLFRSDPYYSDNLSFERTYQLAHPPRAVKPWHAFRRRNSRRMRILILSVTHQVGHGVAVVVDVHARHLAAEGHHIILGGPKSANDFDYAGCDRVYFDGPQEAADYTMRHGVDCVVMHTPPFFSTTRWLGPGVKTVVFDHGEPPPELFPDSDARYHQLIEKNFCLEMADALYANSQATRDESGHPRMRVMPLGNTHLAQWDAAAMLPRRTRTREALGLQNKLLVLNVCRFHENERYYKGIDDYCALKNRLERDYPDQADRFVFALAGKGERRDVEAMEQRGLRVFANVSDEEMLDLYCCADLYVNLSKWEGYNLGIGQALAMGLDVVASDIPVHRTFPVFTSSDAAKQAQQLLEIATHQRIRTARATSWEASLRQLSRELDQVVYGQG